MDVLYPTHNAGYDISHGVGWDYVLHKGVWRCLVRICGNQPCAIFYSPTPCQGLRAARSTDMKTLLKVLVFAAIAFAVSCPVQAYDFSVDGFLFNIIDESEVDRDLALEFDDDGNPILPKCAEITYDPAKHDARLGSYSGALTIPAEVSYNGDTYLVITVGHEAFRYCDALTSLSGGSMIRYIKDYAFADCGITDCGFMADSGQSIIKEIGEYAFAKSNIKKIRLYDTTHIGQYAFSDSKVEEIEFGSNEPACGVFIPDYCFKGCASLNLIYGGDEVTSVGMSAFENCTKLREILPSEYIGEKAYKGCGLDYLTISPYTKYISAQAFSGCKGLRNITIEGSSNVLEFDDRMQVFKGCYDISVIEIGRQMVTDAETREICNPFEGCTAERLIFSSWGLSLPMTATSFPNLKSIECETAIPPQIGTLSAPQYTDIVVTVPASVLQSYKNSPYWEDFYHLNASDISISGPIERNGLYYTPGSVVRNPFGDYKGTFEIPVAVEYDGESYDVFLIGKEAFFNCPNVKKVTFAAGSRVSFIESNAFAWSGIETIELPERGGMDETNLLFGENTFWNCQNLTAVKLPESVQNIARGMFQDCPKLSKINFPAGIDRIEDWAFSGCAALTEVDLSGCENFRSIERGAFEKCNISNLKLPAGGYSIENGAFEGNKITDIVIPEEYWVEDYAFSGNPISNITIGNRVVIYKNGEIASGADIKTLTVEGRLNLNPNPNATTDQCNWLGAKTVDKIVILNHCYDFDWNWPTWNVKEIEMRLDYAPLIDDYFTEEQYRDIIVTVPESAYELYREAPVWCKFKNLRGVDFSGIESVGNDDIVICGGNGCVAISGVKAGTAITIHTIDGKCVASTKTPDGGSVEIPLRRGIYIVNIAGGRPRKVPVK